MTASFYIIIRSRLSEISLTHLGAQVTIHKQDNHFSLNLTSYAVLSNVVLSAKNLARQIFCVQESATNEPDAKLA